jgi:hypothetical protein
MEARVFLVMHFMGNLLKFFDDECGKRFAVCFLVAVGGVAQGYYGH